MHSHSVRLARRAENCFTGAMDGSLWRRHLPWILVLVMTVTGVGFYVRSPVWEFEVDLRDEKVAASPASELYRRIAAKIHDPDLKGKPVQLTVLFRSEVGWQREVFLLGDGPGDPVTAEVRREGPRINDEKVSMRQAQERLGVLADAAGAVGTTAYVVLAPPDCSLRELADFLRMGKTRILWAVHLP